MENESSGESQDEFNAEPELEEENEIDGDDEQTHAETQESEVPLNSNDRTSPKEQKSPVPWIPSPREETIQAKIYDIVPTM